MGRVSFGFAAGCEAVAMPHPQQHVIPGYAPGLGLALCGLLGQGRTKGIPQNVEGTSTVWRGEVKNYLRRLGVLE